MIGVDVAQVFTVYFVLNVMTGVVKNVEEKMFANTFRLRTKACAAFLRLQWIFSSQLVVMAIFRSSFV